MTTEFKYIVDDILKKYVYNCPENILDDKIHLMFQLQAAYWFYIDYYCSTNPNLPNLKEKEFMNYLVNHCIFLYIRLPKFNEEYKQWLTYSSKIPVCGSILIDPTFNYCLMLECHIGEKKHVAFPKGKINKNETTVECAIRETFEETGYDISKSIDETLFIEDFVKGKCVRLYLIFNVNMNTSFYPQQKGEINGYKWYPISKIPMSILWSNILDLLKKKIYEEEMYKEYGIKKYTKSKKESKSNKIKKIKNILDEKGNKYMSRETECFLHSNVMSSDQMINIII
jgi:mRNA-decapping enzyme subunit 2